MSLPRDFVDGDRVQYDGHVYVVRSASNTGFRLQAVGDSPSVHGHLAQPSHLKGWGEGPRWTKLIEEEPKQAPAQPIETCKHAVPQPIALEPIRYAVKFSGDEWRRKSDMASWAEMQAEAERSFMRRLRAIPYCALQDAPCELFVDAESVADGELVCTGMIVCSACESAAESVPCMEVVSNGVDVGWYTVHTGTITITGTGTP